jgi:hypothetical protein
MTAYRKNRIVLELINRFFGFWGINLGNPTPATPTPPVFIGIFAAPRTPVITSVPLTLSKDLQMLTVAMDLPRESAADLPRGVASASPKNFRQNPQYLRLDLAKEQQSRRQSRPILIAFE